jgi:fibronectin-binding autotransporter adhesin
MSSYTYTQSVNDLVQLEAYLLTFSLPITFLNSTPTTIIINTSSVLTGPQVTTLTGALSSYTNPLPLEALDINETTESTSITTGALVIDGGVGIAKNLSVGGNISAVGTMSITDTTQSSSTTTGSIITAGGMGVAKILYVGGSSTIGGALAINGTADSNYSTNTGALKVFGGASFAKKVYIDDTTDSTSVTDGSIVTSGALSVGKQLRVGGTLTGVVSSFSGTIETLSTTDSTYAVNTGAFKCLGGASISKKVFIGDTTSSTSTATGALTISGGLAISNTTDSVSSTSGGSFTTAGGLSIAKTLRVGGTVNATSTTTGSLIVTGGAGITGNLYAANIYSNGVQLVNGGSSYAAGTNISITGTTISVSSSPSFSGSLSVTGSTTLTSISATTGTFSGATTHTGASTFGSTLSVAGASTLAALSATTGTFSSTTTHTGASTFGSTLAVTGASTFGSTLAVTGASTFGSTLSVTGASTFGSTLRVIGSTELEDMSAITVSAITGYFNGATTHTGASTFGSTVTGTLSTSSTSSTTGSLLLSGGLAINNTTNASSSTSGGSFTTAGGLSVAKKLYIGSDLNVSGNTNLAMTLSLTESGSTVASASALYSNPSSTAITGSNSVYFNYFNSPTTIPTSFTGVASNLYIAGPPTDITGGTGFALNVNAGPSRINGQVFLNASSSSSSNTLYVYSFGVGGSDGIIIDGPSGTNTIMGFASNNTRYYSTGIDQADSFKFKYNRGLFNAGNTTMSLDQSGIISIPGTVASTSSFNGILITEGGIGINNITNASSATNGGSITTAGGLAVAKDVYIGGNGYTNGNYLIPTYFQSATDLTNSSTTLNTFQTKLTLTTDSLPAGNYILSTNTVNRLFEVRGFLDNTTVLKLASRRLDTTTTLFPYIATGVITLTAGVHTIELEYRRVDTTTLNIREADIMLYRVS